MEKQKKHQLHQALQQMRFQLLGSTQKEIAERLGISQRQWNHIKVGDREITDRLIERAGFVTRQHRISQIPMTFSPLADWARYAFIRAQNYDDLFEIERRLLIDMKNQTEDVGLMALYGATQMSLWWIAFNPEDKTIGTSNRLERAKANWTKAAKFVPKSELAGSVFIINALTVRIIYETFFENTGQQKASEENYEQYRNFANKFGWISAWRDSLEQAALLNDGKLIDDNFNQLIAAVDSKLIPVNDQFEVLVPEFHLIDGKDALLKRPSYKQWLKKITPISFKKVA